MRKAAVAVSMLEFLRTGHFGPVHLGISRDQLRDHFGEPEYWSQGSSRHPTRTPARAAVWKYGDIEFHFNGNTLWMIFADNVTKLTGGKAVDLNPWVLNGILTVKQALSDFEDVGISCQRIDWTLDDDTERFQVGSGVGLVYTGAKYDADDGKQLRSLAPADMTFNGFSYRIGETR